MIRLILLLLLSCSQINVYSQNLDSLTFPSTITLHTNIYQSFTVGSGTTTNLSYDFKVDDGKFKSTGYFGDGLRSYIISNPGAIMELDAFRSHRVCSLIGYGACLGGTLLALSVGMDDKPGSSYDPYTGNTSNSTKVINTTGIVFLVAAVAGLIYGGWNYFAASEHIYNAVDVYNRGRLSNIDDSKGKYSIDLGFSENKFCLQIPF